MSHRAFVPALLAATLSLPAAGLAAPYAYGDIALGAPYAAMERTLDFRDIEAALRAAQAQKLPRPDLGRRGYGCMLRSDVHADLTCVSHDEKIDGTETREIRLQFLEGIVHQFSITAELQYRDIVLNMLTRGYGAPRVDAGDDALRWENGESRIAAHTGKDLVFVVFELAGYPAAVDRKRNGGRPVNECR